MKFVTVGVVGAGAWGKGIASLLAANKHEFTIVDKGEELPQTDVLFLTVPAESIREVVKRIKDKKTIVVNCAKGIEKDTHKMPYQIVREVLGKNVEYLTLIGPSFAEEVIQKMPTIVNLGHKDKESYLIVKSILQTDYFRIRGTPAIEALEMAGAFKNVYAIAAGICEGLGFRTNTRTKLILLALEELHSLLYKLKIHTEARANIGIVGDMVLTCSSPESRNFSFGNYLTKHKTHEALHRVGATVEGYNTLASVEYFKKKSKLPLPLASFVVDVVKNDNPKSVSSKFANFVKKV